MTGPLRETARGLVLDVRATPKAAHDSVQGLTTLPDGRHAVAVRVTVAPEKGKANGAVQSLLAKAIGIPKSALTLVSGETDRTKVFKVESHADAVHHWLRGLKE